MENLTNTSLFNNITLNQTVAPKAMPQYVFSCDTFKPPGFEMSVAEFKKFITFQKRLYLTLPFIGALSIIFNIVNVIVWTRKRNKKLSVSYYLIALAISDIGLGITYLLKGLDINFLYEIEEYRPVASVNLRVINSYLPYVFGMTNFWITVALAVERAICVALPTRARSICTVKKAKWISATVVILPFFLHIPEIFLHDFRLAFLPCGLGWLPTFSKTAFGENKYTDTFVYLILNTIVQIFVPYGLVLIANTVLIVSLVKASRRRGRLTGNAEEDYSKEIGIARMIIVITVSFILLNIPYVTFSSFGSTNNGFRYSYGFFMLIAIDRLFNGLNMLVNLCTYSLLSTNFKLTLKEMFEGRSTKRSGSSSADSKVTEETSEGTSGQKF